MSQIWMCNKCGSINDSLRNKKCKWCGGSAKDSKTFDNSPLLNNNENYANKVLNNLK